MVYTVYETNCIVFDIKNIQENDCLIKVFSDKFGFINVIATSFRKESSKLKGNIKSFSINKIAVVRGKEFFRLTDVNHVFLFSKSKSLVNFLKHAESLFFNDEMDYFDHINTEMYDMIIHLCKFIIYIVKSDNLNKKQYLEMVSIFFTVYVRGLQGFVEKTKIDIPLKEKEEGLIIWFDLNILNLNNLYKKISP
jgi:hypothetical protein